MQCISVLKRGIDSRKHDIRRVVYSSFHPRNGKFLERESDGDKFKILKFTDGCDPSALMTVSEILIFIEDIRIVIGESRNDNEMCNHLKEIIFMCKLCVWNIDDFYLEITPFGIGIDYPIALPEKYRFNISSL